MSQLRTRKLVNEVYRLKLPAPLIPKTAKSTFDSVNVEGATNIAAKADSSEGDDTHVLVTNDIVCNASTDAVGEPISATASKETETVSARIPSQAIVPSGVPIVIKGHHKFVFLSGVDSSYQFNNVPSSCVGVLNIFLSD